MTLNGYDEELFGYNTKNKNGELPDADMIKAVQCPIGTIVSWLKTFGTADSGTTTSATASKLVQTGQNFVTTCKVGMIVKNTTDTTWAYITAVDSDTTLSISSDIMASAEDFIIYKTPRIPDGWIECNGVGNFDDTDSPFHGEAIPDLNTTQSFLRGSLTSGTAGGEDTHILTEAELAAHTHTYDKVVEAGSYFGVGSAEGGVSSTASGSIGSDTAHENKPVFYEVVMIIRYK